VKKPPNSLAAIFRKVLLLGALLPGPASAQEAPPPAPKSIGAIVDFKGGDPGDEKMRVEYSYGNDSRLILVIRGVHMNAAARSNPAKAVGGELAVKGNQIQISPKEIYGEGGAVESINIYTLRYIIPDVKPGIYRLVHDDTNAEGSDQVIDISLDLKKPVKKSLVVQAKHVPPPPPAK
jgi:hypothetical protein